MACDYEGFPLGVSSLTFRDAPDIDGLIERLHRVALGYVELHGVHLPLSLKQIEVKEALVRLRDAGLAVTAYGDVRLGMDEGRDRRVMNFCRNGGFQTVCADFSPDRLDDVCSLAEEYGVRIALVHGWPHPSWGRIGEISRAVRDATPWLGVRLDTAACVRAGEDPAAAVETLSGRIFGIHLTDAARLPGGALGAVPLGAGRVKLGAVLERLVAQRYGGFMSLAVEGEPEDPTAELLRSFAGFMAAARGVRR